MWTALPFDHESPEPFLRGAHMVGHHRDGVVEPNDLTHALDGLGRGIVDALHATAENGGLRKRRELHARQPNIDAIDGRSIDLRRGVETLRRRADQLEILRSLEHDVPGHGHEGGVGGKFAVFDRSPRRRVKHFAALCAARRRIDIPPLCRRRHQHGPRSRTGQAQRLPRPAYRVGVAGGLHADERIGVELLVGRRMLEMHLLHLHLQLFGDQHRDGGIGALAHLHIGHGQDDLPITFNADEGVRHEGVVGRVRFAASER